MLQLIQILGLPFLACIIMGTILGYLGIHVLRREVIFIDIALAQVAVVGAIAAHFAFGVHADAWFSRICSLGAVFAIAAFYAMTRSDIIQISLESVIGISYAIAAAAALFLVGIAPGGHMHIQDILSGSLLWTGWRDIIESVLVFSAIGFCFYIFRKPLMRLSNNYQQSCANGFKPVLWDFVFYMLLGIAITLSVQLAGIVVVFAYLIIPATISALFSPHWGIRILIIWTATTTASLGGLLFAYYFDFSVGPSVALFLGSELIVAAVIGMIVSGYTR